MPKKIKIFDTTLRDGEQTPGINLNIQEKVEIAKQLERLGVDIIEAGFAIASSGDYNAIQAVSKEIKKSTIASLCRSLEKDIDRSWEALKGAADPRLHIFIATSDIHMKHKLKMSEEEVIEQAVSAIKYAKKYCSNIEFSAEDAARSRQEFLHRVIEEVIKAGAICVNIPDTVGYTSPKEFGMIIKDIKEQVNGIEKVDISVHCHDDLGMAVANTLVALENGASQAECAMNGLGERAGNASLEEVVMALTTRKNYYNLSHNIDTTQLYRTSKLVSSITGVSVQPNKAIVGANAFAHESGIHQHGVLSEKTTYEIMTPESIGLPTNTMVLGKHSGSHAFEEKLKEMGYTFEKETVGKLFTKFKELTDRKKVIHDDDIQAIIEERVAQIPELYKLKSFQISSGNKVISNAVIELYKEEDLITEAATGDGPINAIFNAIDRAAGIELKLIEYKLRAVTSGKDALGEVTVKVSNNGTPFMGRGVSVDILESSAKAYINSINRMLSEKTL